MSDYGIWGWVAMFAAFQFYLAVYILVQTVAGMMIDLQPDVVCFGIGPRLFGVRWRGADWRIAGIPLGGYTKWAGESDEESVNIPAAIPFDRLKTAQKVMTGSAGPLSNLALGILILAGLNHFGRQEPQFVSQPPVIGWTRPGSTLAFAGLAAGDEVLSVGFGGDRVSTGSWRALLEALSRAGGREVSIQVRRDGNQMSLRADASPAPVLDIAHRIPPAGSGAPQPGEPVMVRSLGWSDSFRVAIVDTIEGASSTWRWAFKDAEYGAKPTPDNGYTRLLSHRFTSGTSGLAVTLGLFGFWLAVLNLAPIPTLNGGTIAIACMEAVAGRPLSLSLKEGLFKVGFVLMLGWWGYIIYRAVSHT